jgi:hypothetical protein
MGTMKAAVTYTPGGPEVLKIEQRPIPTPQPGQVLNRVRAFGLNRSELFTRQCLSRLKANSGVASTDPDHNTSLVIGNLFHSRWRSLILLFRPAC